MLGVGIALIVLGYGMLYSGVSNFSSVQSDGSTKGWGFLKSIIPPSIAGTSLQAYTGPNVKQASDNIGNLANTIQAGGSSPAASSGPAVNA